MWCLWKGFLQGPSQYKDRLSSCGIPMFKIGRSRDRLIFNMGIPILVRRHLYIETAPCCYSYCDVGDMTRLQFIACFVMWYKMYSSLLFVSLLGRIWKLFHFLCISSCEGYESNFGLLFILCYRVPNIYIYICICIYIYIPSLFVIRKDWNILRFLIILWI